jgi:hypothetical protein
MDCVWIKEVKKGPRFARAVEPKTESRRVGKVQFEGWARGYLLLASLNDYLAGSLGMSTEAEN